MMWPKTLSYKHVSFTTSLLCNEPEVEALCGNFGTLKSNTFASHSLATQNLRELREQ